LPLGAGDVSFNPAITEQEFHTFSLLAAQAIFATPVEPARATGLTQFDVGVAANLVQVDTGAPYWQHAVASKVTTGDYFAVPRVVVSKGFSAATVSVSYAKFGDTTARVWGGALDLPVINGGTLRPTLAGRLSYAKLSGVDPLRLTTYGAELFLSKGFGPVTPYGAIGIMRDDARGTIPPTSLTPRLTLSDKSNTTRYTLGVRVSMVLPKLVVEASQADKRSYAAKVSFGF
jgi:hypothetical protein